MIQGIARSPPVDSQEGLLHQIHGGFPVPGHVKQVSEQPGSVPAKEPVKASFLPAHVGNHKLLIGSLVIWFIFLASHLALTRPPRISMHPGFSSFFGLSGLG